jgi:transmembrane sensor
MSTSPESYNEIELAAAEWLSRQDGGLTATQETELARWLARDPRHAEAFHELAAAWGQLDLVRRGSAPIRELPAARLVRFPRTIALAMAASIAVAAIAWHVRSRGDAPFATAAITDAGATRSLQLPDGSIAQLNANSAVEVRYDLTSRHVRLLRGEAHFTVARNKSKPFIVVVGQVAVRAVGTAFNVRLTSASVEVLVTEGRVSVDDAGKRQSLLLGSKPREGEDPVLAAGERVVVSLTPAQAAPATATVAVVPAVEIKKALAWKEPRLEFDTVPLKTIVAEFNRHNEYKLMIADVRLEILRFGGTFPANDYESLVRLLVQNYGVVAETQEHQTILRLAPVNPVPQK